MLKHHRDSNGRSGLSINHETSTKTERKATVISIIWNSFFSTTEHAAVVLLIFTTMIFTTTWCFCYGRPME